MERLRRPTKEQAQKFADVLRSGDFKQGRGLLQTRRGHCCLGVACRIFIPAGKLKLDSADRLYGFLPTTQPNSPQWLHDLDEHVKRKIGISLVDLNDDKRYSFDQIADVIELVYVHKALD